MTRKLNIYRSLLVLVITAPLVSGCALLKFDPSLDPSQDYGMNSGRDWRNNADSSPSRDSDESDRQSRILAAISRQDILLGMDQQEVMAAWGSPRDVETAGNPGSGAERWIYYSGNSLTYGMSKPKIVYFENGHVVGWESANR